MKKSTWRQSLLVTTSGFQGKPDSLIFAFIFIPLIRRYRWPAAIWWHANSSICSSQGDSPRALPPHQQILYDRNVPRPFLPLFHPAWIRSACRKHQLALKSTWVTGNCIIIEYKPRKKNLKRQEEEKDEAPELHLISLPVPASYLPFSHVLTNFPLFGTGRCTEWHGILK